MHTNEGKTAIFNHNGGFDGEVIIKEKSTGAEITVDFEDLKMLVAQYVMREKISKLESATPDEILFHES